MDSSIPATASKAPREKAAHRRCTESKRVLKFDLFGTPIHLLYPDGEDSHRSVLGSCLSILLMLTTLVYLGQNISIMLQRSDTTFTSYVEEGHFNDTATFGQEDGFRVAVALVDYGSAYFN